MGEGGISRIRSFNRTVTQRIGVLDDEYLARGRTLGASRVLWEVGTGLDVRSLRRRLDLDSGYLSRLLRSLEEEGLVTVATAEEDKRVRTVRLTDAGRREREVLDRRSDDLARSLLAPLNDDQRGRLVAAMAEVERLLTAGLVAVDVEDAASADAQACIQSYFEELDERFETGFDPDHALPADAAGFRAPAGLFLVGRLRGDPVACGGWKLEPDGSAYVKRMWVAPSARGLGLGRRMLQALEQHARERGVTVARLETNEALREAIALYRSSGYVEVAPFNDEPYAHHWFEKPLGRDV